MNFLEEKDFDITSSRGKHERIQTSHSEKGFG